MPGFFVNVDVILAAVSAGLIVACLIVLCRSGSNPRRRASAGIAMCIGGMNIGQAVARLIRGTPIGYSWLEHVLVLSGVPFLIAAVVIMVGTGSGWFQSSTRAKAGRISA